MQGYRIGIGFDVHKYSETEAQYLRVGGIDIPYHHSLEGHSDADVVLHAIVDAILGAIGENDIGYHFPPSDQRYKNADSSLFIAKALEMMRGKNARIENVDTTIICEEPKIAPFRYAIKTRLAELLNVDTNRINVKATTTEGMGFTGRKEGIAAQAAVLIEMH